MTFSLPELGIYISLIMFIIGFIGMLCRKNIIFIMLSVELMLNAANLAFVSASSLTESLDGQVIMFVVIAIAACEAAVGLALIMALYRAKSTIEIDVLRILRG